jgi:hypothetical protein
MSCHISNLQSIGCDSHDVICAFDWLSIRLDDSIFDREDFNSKFMIRHIEANRINKQVDTILCRCFIGGSDGRQLSEFNAARRRAQLYFQNKGIRLIIKCYGNDEVKNVLEWNPSTLVDRLLEADFHIFITHFHEANIAKTASWNMHNILSNLDRLKYHLGNLMGERNKCPIFRQGKREVYECLPDYCLPTLIVDLPTSTWDPLHPISAQDADRVHA